MPTADQPYSLDSFFNLALSDEGSAVDSWVLDSEFRAFEEWKLRLCPLNAVLLGAALENGLWPPIRCHAVWDACLLVVVKRHGVDSDPLFCDICRFHSCPAVLYVEALAEALAGAACRTPTARKTPREALNILYTFQSR